MFKGCRYLIVLGSFLIAACSPNSPTPTPTATATATLTQTAVSIVAAPTNSNNALPPSWTPKPTLTPAPTRTLVSTPTAIPTFTQDQLCSEFAVLTPKTDTAFAFNDVVTFSWTGVPRSRTMAMLLLRQGETEGLKMDVPFEGAGVFPIPLRTLVGSGTFEWRAYVIDETYGAICEQRGTLIRKPPPYF